MAFQIPARAKMTSVTTGTGTLTLAASADTSLRSFQASVANGPVMYVLSGGSGGSAYFELGVGTFTSPTTLTRTNPPIISSNAGALVNIPSGTTDVFLVWHAGSVATDSFSGTKSQALADAGNNQLFTGAGASNYNLLARSAIPLGFEQFIVNAGTNTLTVVRNGTDTINGVGGNFALPPNAAGVLYPGAAGDWRFEVFFSYSDPARTTIDNNFTADQTIVSTDASASAGPNLNLDRNSASPAASDGLGIVNFLGRSSTAVQRLYAAINGYIESATNGSESGRIVFQTRRSGSLSERLHIGFGLFWPSVTGGDKGNSTINITSYYKDGTLLPVQQKFTSSDQTITSAGALTLAHGLGATPEFIECFLVNVTNEAGYTTGQVLPVAPNSLGAATNDLGFSAIIDATNVTIRYGAHNGVFSINHATTGVSTGITNANWKLRVKAYA
jgi:hypothetical protein